MQLLNIILLSKNVLTICVAIIFVWLAFAGMGAMLKDSQKADEIFTCYFQLAFISYLGAGFIVKIFSKILNCKVSFNTLNFDPSWIFILALGSLFFIYLSFHSFAIELYAGVFALSLIPASLFRIIISGAVSIFADSNKLESILINSKESKIL